MQSLSPTHFKVGQKIKVLRLEQSLTQEDLAYKVGIDRSYVGFVDTKNI